MVSRFEDLLNVGRGRAALVARLLLGGLFAISGVEKMLDARSFLSALETYPLPDGLIPFGVLVPPLEVAVGAALILSIASRLAAQVSFGMLLGFSLLLGSGMVSGRLGVCGCFGTLLESSPGWALVRNGVLMTFAWVVAARYNEKESRVRRWQLGFVGGLLLIGGALAGYTTHTPLVDRSLARAGEMFPSEGYRDEVPTLERRQLAFVLTSACRSCWNAMANVNQLAEEGSWDVFAVTASSSWEIEWLERNFHPRFPIYTYDTVRFGETFRYWPSLYYLVDGRIIGKIEGDIPTVKAFTDFHLEGWKAR